jgi:hypothetical protein
VTRICFSYQSQATTWVPGLCSLLRRQLTVTSNCFDFVECYTKRLATETLEALQADEKCILRRSTLKPLSAAHNSNSSTVAST